MKKLKLGFTDTHNHLAMFFYSILSTRYEIEMDNENPEYLIFGDNNFGNQNLRYDKNKVTKIFYTGENQRPENYDCHYAISFDHNYESWHYRLPLFVIYMWAWKHLHGMKYNMDYVLGNIEPQEKTSFASFVVSNPNCKERNNFFELLNKYQPVDSGGKLFNNINANIQGEQGKIDFLSTRKFNICFEPFTHPGYVTEKIMHAFYAGTIPIYWGNELIASDFNRDSFINVHDFPTFEDAIEYIIKVDIDSNLYDKILAAPKFINNIPPSYLILDNFLNWFDAVVYNKIMQR